MKLTAFEPSRFTQSRLFIADCGDNKYLVKSYLGAQAVFRRDLETRKLRRWLEMDFPVPELYDIAVDDALQPCLAMNYIEGITLTNYLQQSRFSLDEKKASLKAIFDCNAQRHQLALKTNDSLLIHTDLNTDNILVANRAFFYIDFEHPAKEKSLALAVAQEIATFARRVASNMNKEHLREIVAMLLAAYDYDHFLFGQIVALTKKRPLQAIHRYRDRKKKSKNPLLITRYDIADAVGQLL